MNPTTELRNAAISLGLCRQWQTEWPDTLTPDDLIAMFRRGQDFCIAHDFPSLGYIRETFTSADLERGGVYLDTILGNPGSARVLGNGTYIFLGSCRGTVRFPRWTAAVLYVRHDSRIRIEADEFSRIQVRLFDEAEAKILPIDPSARISIFDRR